jgi:hypothetical protein
MICNKQYLNAIRLLIIKKDDVFIIVVVICVMKERRSVIRVEIEKRVLNRNIDELKLDLFNDKRRDEMESDCDRRRYIEL